MVILFINRKFHQKSKLFGKEKIEILVKNQTFCEKVKFRVESKSC